MKTKSRFITFDLLVVALLAFVITCSAWSDVFALSAVDNNNSTVYNDHKYMLFLTDYSWDAAKAECESVGGHLVTITSEEEQAAVESILLATRESYWIGGTENNGDITWVTGESASYTHWQSGQPDDSGATYMQMFSSGNNGGYSAGYWDDTYLNGDTGGGIKVQGYICEWDSLSDFDEDKINTFAINLATDTWSFRNPGKGGVRLENYERMLSPAAARLMYDINGSCDGGLCFGMSQTVLASSKGFPKATSYEKQYSGYNVLYAKNLADVSEQDYTHEINTSAIDLIRCFHVYQYSFNSCFNRLGTRNNLYGLYESAFNYQNLNGDPVMVVFTQGFIRKGEHALAVLGVAAEDENDVYIQVYDSNEPGQTMMIHIMDNFSRFVYEMHTRDGGIKTNGTSSDNTAITFFKITDDVIKQYKSTAGSHKQQKGAEDGMLVALSSSSDEVFSYQDKSYSADAIYNDESDSLYSVINTSGSKDGDDAPFMFWTADNKSPITIDYVAPETEVSVANNDKIIVAKSSVESSVKVDQSNKVTIDSDEEGTFTVDYKIPSEGKVDTVTIEGHGSDSVSVTPSGDNLILNGVESCTVTTTETVTADNGQESTTELSTQTLNNLDVNSDIEIETEIPQASAELGEVKLSKTEYVYDGKTKKPAVIVTDANGAAVPDSQYDVLTGNKGKAIGIYEITVVFKDKYENCENVVLSYKIVPAKTTIKAKAGKKQVKLTAKKVKGKGIRYQFAVRKAGTKKWKIYTSKKNTYKVKKLKAKKKYEVRVRAFAESRGENNQYWEKKVYGKWSKTKKVKIK